MLTEMQVRQMLENKQIAKAVAETELIRLHHDTTSTYCDTNFTCRDLDQLEAQIAVLNYILIA